MRVVVLTNNDLTGSLIFSPVFDVTGIDVPAVFIASSPSKKHSSMVGAAISLMKKMNWRYWLFLSATNALFLVFDRVTRFLQLKPGFGNLRSLRREAEIHGSEVASVSGFNSPEFKQRLRQIAPDLLLIRVSAILDEELLAIPRSSTWCVHSSLLPAYGGIAGEFQALRDGSKVIGSTVFEVTPRLDEGPVLAQTWFETTPTGSLFEHILANNNSAGILLADMLGAKVKGDTRPLAVFPAQMPKSYFSWPKTPDVLAFAARGRSLISLRELAALMFSAMRLKGFRISG